MTVSQAWRAAIRLASAPYEGPWLAACTNAGPRRSNAIVGGHPPPDSPAS
jgi:hypothetical protein